MPTTREPPIVILILRVILNTNIICSRCTTSPACLFMICHKWLFIILYYSKEEEKTIFSMHACTHAHLEETHHHLHTLSCPPGCHQCLRCRRSLRVSLVSALLRVHCGGRKSQVLQGTSTSCLHRPCSTHGSLPDKYNLLVTCPQDVAKTI